MRRCRYVWPHLVEGDVDAALGESPGCLAPGKAATDDRRAQVVRDASTSSEGANSCSQTRQRRNSPRTFVERCSAPT